MAESRSLLLALPDELKHYILAAVNPRDLVTLYQCCTYLRGYIHKNTWLFKTLYLNHFDIPFRAKKPNFSWESELRKALLLEKILVSENVELKRSKLDIVSRLIVSLLSNACPTPSESRNVAFLSNHFKDQRNIDNFLCSSSIWNYTGTNDQIPAETESLRQLSAKLHCLYGVPIYKLPAQVRREHLLVGIQAMEAPSIPIEFIARSRVYDLRKYTGASFWGPFLADGSRRIDWEMLEAIIVVLHCKMKNFKKENNDFHSLWEKPFAEVVSRIRRALPTSIPTSLGGRILYLACQDPYNITGTWLQVSAPNINK